MISFFIEGGWGMWPVLALSLVTIGAAYRFSKAPDLLKLRFLGAIGLTTIVTTILATWTNVSAVLSYVEDPARVSEGDLHRTLMVGLMESSRPATLAGLMLILAGTLITVGLWRVTSKRALAA